MYSLYKNKYNRLQYPLFLCAGDDMEGSELRLIMPAAAAATAALDVLC